MANKYFFSSNKYFCRFEVTSHKPIPIAAHPIRATASITTKIVIVIEFDEVCLPVLTKN